MQTAKAAQKRTSQGQINLQQTFFEHLAELRVRLFYIAVAFVAGGILGYTFQDRIATFLLVPLHGEKLIYLTPGGGLDFIFKISLYSGMLVALPVAVYQIFRYISPLIKTPQTRKFTAFILIASGVLAIIGVVFGYYIIMPSALEFLAHFAGKYVQPNLTATSYIDFVALHSLGVAVIFQLPIVLLLINSVSGPIKPVKLLKSEQYVVLGSIVLAALIAPPDLKNQTLVALPVFLMYQLGVVGVLLQNRYRARFAPRAARYARIVRPDIISKQVNSAAHPSTRFVTGVNIVEHPLPVQARSTSMTRPVSKMRPTPLSIDGIVSPPR